jgi:diaminohydroxyphosphoribosylaminopyrimidine deaminase / 5-amino-6-(5-phosphoribosylamino)uracil reductase
MQPTLGLGADRARPRSDNANAAASRTRWASKLISDARWMAAALALSERGRARSAPNPNVGCMIIKDDRVIGRGWTQAGGRPHAEAMALAQAGGAARGATAYVTLEPCAHESARGPACADALIEAGIVRIVAALTDPDPRTNGTGLARLRDAQIAVESGLLEQDARRAMSGWLSQRERGRPFVTLKLATSLDGCIALAGGESRWITGEAARAHAHLERALSNAIVVGRGTFDTDAPALDVRLRGLEDRSPTRIILSKSKTADGWRQLASPEAIADLDAHYLLVEGGAQTAASFLKADLVDRILLTRAPILIGGGKASLGDIGLASLSQAHGRWRRTDMRPLGIDTLDVYERA